MENVTKSHYPLYTEAKNYGECERITHVGYIKTYKTGRKDNYTQQKMSQFAVITAIQNLNQTKKTETMKCQMYCCQNKNRTGK